MILSHFASPSRLLLSFAVTVLLPPGMRFAAVSMEERRLRRRHAPFPSAHFFSYLFERRGCCVWLRAGALSPFVRRTI